MTKLYDNLSLAVRPNPGHSGLADIGVEIEGGFVPITSITTGRLAKIVAQGREAAAAAAAAAPPATPTG